MIYYRLISRYCRKHTHPHLQTLTEQLDTRLVKHCVLMNSGSPAAVKVAHTELFVRAHTHINAQTHTYRNTTPSSGETASIRAGTSVAGGVQRGAALVGHTAGGEPLVM